MVVRSIARAICATTFLLGGCDRGSSPNLPDSVQERRAVEPRVTVALGSARELENSSYAVSFTTGPAGALNPGDKITITAPIGTDFSDTDTGWQVEAGAAPVVITDVTGRPDGGDFTLNQVAVTVGSPIAADTPVAVTAAWVTNPGPGKDRFVLVHTTVEPDPEASNAYEIQGNGRVEWRAYQDPTVPLERCWGSAVGTTECPARSYMIYEPRGARAQGRALLVDLPGCFSTAALEARWSRFHELAADHGFVVLFPQQSLRANGGRCWNWFDASHQHRGAGEPALIAGITQQVIEEYRIDPDRVYVAGISAGGAMSNIMMVTYPDLFAAGVVNAGCEYGGLPCLGAPSAQPPLVAAQAAVAEMGPRLRSVPVFAVTGDLDAVVPPLNAEQVVQQWLATDSIRRSGEASPLPVLPTESHRESPPGRQVYTVDIWRDAAGCLLAQRWTVHGMAHQWSGAPSNGSPIDTAVADPNGPDLRTAIIDFFAAHPRSAACQ